MLIRSPAGARRDRVEVERTEVWLSTPEPRERANLLIHIGYHKTGTTWLQHVLFQGDKSGFCTRDRFAVHPTEVFVHRDPFSFDPVAARRHFAPDLEHARSTGETFVISHERLSGYPAAGGFDSRDIADRLASTFPEARCLIGIREQVSVLGSMHPQYVEDGGHLSLHRFLHPVNPYGNLPGFRFEFYEYDRLIAHYQRRFGKENVLVLPIELLQRHPQDYLDRVTDFCGAERIAYDPDRVVNPARSLVYVYVKRLVNRFFTRSSLSDLAWFDVPLMRTSFVVLAPVFDFVFRPVDGFLRRRRKAKIVAEVGSRYRSSNARTAQLIGIDLAALGYACADTAEIPDAEGESERRFSAAPVPGADLTEFLVRHPRLRSALEWWLAGRRLPR